MSDSWDDYADGWDDNPDVIEYSKLAFETLKHTTTIAGLRVLDFGCGTGLLSERLSPFVNEVVAIDLSEKMVDVLNAKQLPNVTGIAGDILDEPVRAVEAFAAPFDLIVASSVCAFVSDFDQTLAVLKNLLAPGGMFIQWDWQKTEASGVGFTVLELEQAYARQGFSEHLVKPVFTMESHHGVMPVLMGVAKHG